MKIRESSHDATYNYQGNNELACIIIGRYGILKLWGCNRKVLFARKENDTYRVTVFVKASNFMEA